MGLNRAQGPRSGTRCSQRRAIGVHTPGRGNASSTHTCAQCPNPNAPDLEAQLGSEVLGLQHRLGGRSTRLKSAWRPGGPTPASGSAIVGSRMMVAPVQGRCRRGSTKQARRALREFWASLAGRQKSPGGTASNLTGQRPNQSTHLTFASLSSASSRATAEAQSLQQTHGLASTQGPCRPPPKGSRRPWGRCDRWGGRLAATSGIATPHGSPKPTGSREGPRGRRAPLKERAATHESLAHLRPLRSRSGVNVRSTWGPSGDVSGSFWGRSRPRSSWVR